MSDLIQSLISAGISPSAAIRISAAVDKKVTVTSSTTQVITNATTVVNYQAAQGQPSVFSGPIETQQAAVFSGDSQFSGPVTLDGEVNWGGMLRSPTPVSAVGMLGVTDGSLFFQPIQIAALNNFGLGNPQKVAFAIVPTKDHIVLTGVTYGASTQPTMVPNAATFNAQTAPLTYVTSAIENVGGPTYSVLSTLSDVLPVKQTFSYPTTFTLDPDSCTITAGGTQTVTYLSDVSLDKVPRSCIYAVTSTPAPQATASIVTGGTVALDGKTSNFVTGVTVSTTSATVWSALSAAVVAVTISDP